MSADQLSEVFDLVEVRGVLSGGFVARDRWVSRGPLQTPLKFFAVVSGRARLTTDGIDAPLELEPGDVAMLNNRAWLELEGGSGDGPPREIRPEENGPLTDPAVTDHRTDAIVGGRIDLNPAGRTLLMQALPPVAHLRGSDPSATSLRGTLHRLFEEVRLPRIGAEFAIRQHVQLLVLEMVRAHAGQADLPPGWLRVLTNERLRPAIAMMHAEPGAPWSLADLAGAAAMSRTSFAEHFRSVAGIPPLTYLARWRMLLAQRALRDDEVRVGTLAAQLGYASESAFSTAFKRQVGLSPLRYRQSLTSAPRGLPGQ
ncbi:AraC family transcriptional regulator [Occultella aeris]|uniref:Exoenzyme S synthesis regulatory protein ExsA n=1 Tax=Occultella aeris TaxID=2761496 RepID=A0A7M4DRM8_9MICO|nr:AraC family transcriptional regulator [Occultella aeris]VZO40122.1 Exoenzyme S synthesis regulatory protein ExsA [Occultella aeris]